MPPLSVDSLSSCPTQPYCSLSVNNRALSFLKTIAACLPRAPVLLLASEILESCCNDDTRSPAALMAGPLLKPHTTRDICITRHTSHFIKEAVFASFYYKATVTYWCVQDL